MTKRLFETQQMYSFFDYNKSTRTIQGFVITSIMVNSGKWLYNKSSWDWELIQMNEHFFTIKYNSRVSVIRNNQKYAYWDESKNYRKIVCARKGIKRPRDSNRQLTTQSSANKKSKEEHNTFTMIEYNILT